MIGFELVEQAHALVYEKAMPSTMMVGGIGDRSLDSRCNINSAVEHDDRNSK